MDGSPVGPFPAHYFASNGPVRLHYVVLNENAGRQGPNRTSERPLLLFIHGIPGFWNIWQPQLMHFARHCTVASIDLRGFNDSDQPQARDDYRLPYLIGDVVAVITALKLASQSNVVLVGHDFGAIIAWWVAMLHPQLITALVAAGAPHPRAYLAAREKGALRYSDDFRALLLDSVEGAPLNASLLASRLTMPTQRNELTRALEVSSAEGLRNYYRANSGGAFSGAFPQVRIPVAMIVGGEDRFVSQDFYEMSRAWIEAPSEIVVVPGGDHYLPFNLPAAFNAHLEHLLAKNLRPLQ